MPTLAPGIFAIAYHYFGLSGTVPQKLIGSCFCFSNKEGETLSNIIDTWQPKKRAPGGIGPQTLLFQHLLDAIKEKLGGKS